MSLTSEVRQIEDVRQRLGLEPRHGFLLPGERAPWYSPSHHCFGSAGGLRQREPVPLRRGTLEAAARLAMWVRARPAPAARLRRGLQSAASLCCDPARSSRVPPFSPSPITHEFQAAAFESPAPCTHLCPFFKFFTCLPLAAAVHAANRSSPRQA